MERFLFESLMTTEDQIQKLEKSIADIPAVRKFAIRRLKNGVVLIVEVLRIPAFEIARILAEKGFALERVYEE